MATVGWLLRKLVSIVLAVFSSVKTLYRRVVCRGRRSRRMSGSVLPFTDQNAVIMAAATTSSANVQQSVPANDTTFVQWDSWGTEPVDGASVQRHTSTGQEAEPPADVDYFGDMVPEIKRTTKILLKNRDTNMTNSSISSRLALKNDIPTQGSELQSWEATEGAWGEEEDLDEIAADAQVAVREKRRAQREQRHLLQQRRREEREASRETRGDHLVAVRLPA